ncbi:glycosyltransferase family 4 protein [Salinicoccus halitifaciens]|uniref:Glycosyltransferase involved in cell wall biosynthesis n=1 Tax=Salinicoccus halitifaciens TaxID=1073415 RepID=A0ABV2EC98_9STAP|nr:glycosyltransferase family 4 protein [Salinicoccus halitifaciens]MCD2138783.1 glycosyltransferase family 4 protein [Salinicoccus halitifaciens]
MREKVLIMAPYYSPSFKAGGPVQSIKNIVDNLSNEYDFFIVTSDRDLGDQSPFENIEVDCWIKNGKANVMYTDASKLNIFKINKIITSTNANTIYLNSFFNYKFSIIPTVLKKLKLLPNKKIVLAPRGEFSPGAFKLKKIKKSMYVNFTKLLGLYKHIEFHATAESERNHIMDILGKGKVIKVANNLTANYEGLTFNKKINKKPGNVDLVFVSRIHPKKNLHYAIELLKELKGNITFNIFGPIEDANYWDKCLAIINNLPKNINVKYRGLATREQVNDIFMDNHFFLFPTLGENYGHVISEALIGSCPVIISDETPWRNLEKIQAGWDIPLDNKNEYLETLSCIIKMDEEVYKTFARSAFEFGKKVSNSEDELENYIKLFSFKS